MRASVLLSVIVLFSAQIVSAQQDTVYVARNFTVRTIPRSADIISIDANGVETKFGNDSFTLEINKKEGYLIEARKEGFRSVRKMYMRQRKGGIETDTIELATRMIKLTALPAGCAIYVNDVQVGNDNYELVIPKGEEKKVEIKHAGYKTHTKTFTNNPDEEDPTPDFTFTLKDRIVAISATPKEATIMADNKKVGEGTANVIVKKNTCVTVSVECPGYISKTVSYCNNDELPVLTDNIQLKDRQSHFNITPENAVISVDGKELGNGARDVVIPEGACLQVLVQAPNYASMEETLCNKPMALEKPKIAYTINLAEDEVITHTEESSFANTDFGITINPALSPDDAWKKLCGIVQRYFDEVELQDPSTLYLRTKWAASQPFNLSSSFPRVVRTRLIVKNGGATPLKYIINIQSELSKTGKECQANGAKYPAVSMDECFTPFQRSLRKYKDMDEELQGILGITTDINAEVKTAAPAAAAIETPAPGINDNSAPEEQADNGEGDYFIATWHCITAADTIVISKEAGHYLLSGNGRRIKLNYRDNALSSTDPSVGKVSYQDAHLLWMGKEYEDVKAVAFTSQNQDVAASPGTRDDDNSGHFAGTWKCITTDMTISISKDGDSFILEDGDGKKVTMNYQDGLLQSAEAGQGKVIYNPSTGDIFWQKKEFGPAVAPAQKEEGGVDNNNTEDNATSDTRKMGDGNGGTVGDYLNNKLSSEESVLFQFNANYKKQKDLVYLDYNPNEEGYDKLVVDALYHGILDTRHFTRVAFYQYGSHSDDPVAYDISYTDIVAKADNVQRQSLSGGIVDDYTAILSCKINVTDGKGNALFTHTFDEGKKLGERLHVFVNGSEEDAIKKAVGKLKNNITDYFDEKFPMVALVNSISEQERNGDAKMISVNAGEDMGLTEKTLLKIMDKDKQIGEVKVKSVDQQTSTCKVEDGGDAIAAKINAGDKLDAVSE